MNYIVFLLIIVAIIVLSLAILILWRKLNPPIKLDTEHYDLRDITIDDIDRMEDGSGFEMYLYRLLIELGYSGVYKTMGSRYFGADVVFTDSDGVRNVIQAKRYAIENPVGISAVQEVFSCMRYYKAKKAVVIATTRFTDSCETLAGINYVKLIDRTDLVGIIDAFRAGDILAARKIIEAEPRRILESWSEANSTDLHEVRKDYRAEKYVKKAMSK
ncbi:restriction endonuclease [Paenibacillus amylolyticus]|uniref:Restriction endonuclease n=1 Tax=Paenibacillus amylolyticus TaxID=1451 RepID=A0A5M9WYS9_PAEAM|nr:restriction endonuclease [Paenibacillus amylolyticus]KAA8786692.1 restriction endonuclease [Paenibacillus amylolyticus]